jgi:hypothetical protein
MTQLIPMPNTHLSDDNIQFLVMLLYWQIFTILFFLIAENVLEFATLTGDEISYNNNF